MSITGVSNKVLIKKNVHVEATRRSGKVMEMTELEVSQSLPNLHSILASLAYVNQINSRLLLINSCQQND
jgi:hypothetical protein